MQKGRHPRLLRLSLVISLAACSGNISAGGASGPGAGGDAGSATRDGSDPSAPFVAYESLVRRHSRAELDSTLRDLLGDKSAPAGRFLAEDEFAPYDNGYEQQLASQALIDSLEALSQDVAARVLADTTTRAALVPCTPTGTRDTACFRKTVSQLGRRAFRRALETSEVDAYLPLLELAAAPGGAVKTDFFTAVELFVRAILQDPEFLYRIEVGRGASDGVQTLTSYEIATRLSYLLWGSTPDDLLLSSAESADLQDAEVRRAQAERLLDDPRARTQLARFHAMWLGYRAIPHPAALTAAFASESSALIERVVFEEKRDYLDLFTLEETYVDAMLASHYGLTAPAQTRAWVPYGAAGERAGILAHGSVLSAFSKFSDTSPTQRGIFIRTRLLCQTISSPPANVMVDQPPRSDESPCKAQRYAEHASGSCAGCHGAIDPIGFGLERYDIAGRYREHDQGLPQCSIDGKGALPGLGDFSGPKELASRLIESGQLEPCVVKQYLTFALGRAVAAGDAGGLESLTRAFEAERRGFLALMLALVESDAFARRLESL